MTRNVLSAEEDSRGLLGRELCGPAGSLVYPRGTATGLRWGPGPSLPAEKVPWSRMEDATPGVVFVDSRSCSF